MVMDELPFGKEFPSGDGEKPTFRSLGSSLASLFNPGESIAKNARFIIADLPANTAEVSKILPFILKPAKAPTVRLFAVSYERAAYCPPYNEAGLNVFVRSPVGAGGHTSWIVVNDDTALILGREVLACPKKLADIRYGEEGGHVSASVRRRGVELFSIEADRLEAEEDPGFVFDSNLFNAGGLGQFGFFNPIWCFRLKERIYESYRARGTLDLNDSVCDPIKRYIGEYSNPVQMRMVRMDIYQMRYMLPAGLTGPGWALRTYNMRFR
jgi:hypothetical protein